MTSPVSLWTEAQKQATDAASAGTLPADLRVLDVLVSSRAGTDLTLPLDPEERLYAGALRVSSSNQEEEIDHNRIQTDVTVVTEAPTEVEDRAEEGTQAWARKVKRPTGTTIGWFTVDLEDRRQLVGVYVPTVAANSVAVGALKLGDGGPWFPATPVDTVPLNQRVAFPPMTTQRLMVVFGTTDEQGRFTPASVAIQLPELAVLVAQPPSDLSLSIDKGPAFFSLPGLFPYTQGDRSDTALGTLAPGFVAAVNAARRAQTEGDTLSLHIGASTGGTVNLRLTSAVIGAFLPQAALPPLTLPVPRDGPAQVRIPVGAGRAIGALSLRLDHQPETQQIASPPVRRGPRLAVVSGADGLAQHQILQRLEIDPGLALTAVEPSLTVHRGGTLTLTLYAEEDGAPGLPLTAVSLAVNPGDRQPVTLSLQAPLRLPPRLFVGLSTLDADLWIALGAPDGAGHPIRPTQSLRRAGTGPAMPLPDAAIDARFLRLAPEATPTDRLTLRRGAAAIELSVDRTQQLALSAVAVGEPSIPGGAELLDRLNAHTDDPWLTIELRSPFAGALDLRPLRLLVAPATPAALSP